MRVCPPAGGLDALDPGLDENADAVGLELLGEQRAGVGIEAREQMGVVLDESDLRAHPPEELREFHTHRATAQDDEALGDRARPDRLAIRPVLDVPEPVDVGTAASDPVATTSSSYSSSRSPTPTTPGAARGVSPHELGSLLREPVRVPRVVATVGHLIAPPEHALDVDLACRRLGGSGGEPGGSENLGRAQQRLRG